MLEEYQGSLKTLEEHIGYGFRSPALLKQALTHSSYANENRGGLGTAPLPMSKGSTRARIMSVWSFWEMRCWSW